MELLVDRKWKKPTYTIGKLYVDGKYFSETLEDKDRGLTSAMSDDRIKATKVYAETAIPTGCYIVRMSFSPKFKKRLPRLYGVKGFEGVLIHSGNAAKDTAGCILVGENRDVGKVVNSRATLEKLIKLIEGAEQRCDEVRIAIK